MDKKSFVDSAKIFFQKNSPTILLVGGVIFVAGAAVIACIQTRKIDGAIAENKKELDQIKDLKTVVEDTEAVEYSDAAYKKDIAKIYANAGLKIAKLYAVPLAVGAVGFAMIFESHSIMGERYSSAVAAAMAMERIHAFYRKNVIEELGEEADSRFRHGLKKQIVESTVLDNNGKPKTDKDGNPKTKKEEVLVPKNEEETLAYSPYARVFAKYCPFIQIAKGQNYGSQEWEDSGYYNLEYIQGIEDDMNRKLELNKHVFLNEAYKALGFDPSPEGQDVGWKLDPNDPLSDNHIKFTILPKGCDAKSDAVQSILKGGETDFIIDFNVCGNIRPFIWGERHTGATFPSNPIN